jgi:hypothetical protein
MKLKRSLAVLLFSMIGLTVFAQTKVDSSFHLYILAGQSNMAGRGKITAEYKDLQYNRVLMLDQSSAWVPARHPLHFDKPKSAGVGPGLSFGAAMSEAYPADTIGLIPCAVGGTSITRWEPGAYDQATGTHPYDDALLRIKEAMTRGVVKGVIWLQGESDSNPRAASLDYLDKLATLIAAFRKITGNPALPFVAGELGTYRDNYQLFNQRLSQLPLKVPYTAVVSSEGFQHKGDTTHFDSPSATLYGKRFAEGMLRLQQQAEVKP